MTIAHTQEKLSMDSIKTSLRSSLKPREVSIKIDHNQKARAYSNQMNNKYIKDKTQTL